MREQLLIKKGCGGMDELSITPHEAIAFDAVAEPKVGHE
jgi:hypothetical protein